MIGRANEHNPDPNASMALATGALLALLARARYGIGQKVVTSMVVANIYTNSMRAIDYPGKPETALADADVLGLNALYSLYETAQGWVFLACPRQEEWVHLCQALGAPELLSDPRFQTTVDRRANDTAVRTELATRFQQRTAAQLERLLLDADVACVQADHASFGEYANLDPVMKAIGIMVPVDHPELGPYYRYGNTVTLSETSGRIGAGTLVGQHTREILRELGFSSAEIAELKARNVVTWTEVSPSTDG
jgi:crotonobetainyl-CoA:carnitine CoA-transferase CaiB-like acyl-CoA transferase